MSSTPPKRTLNLPKYGSIETPLGDAQVDQSFDEKQAYYLPTQSSFSCRKCMLIAGPIIAAVLIMGGLAFLLTHNFGHLYPGRGGDSSAYKEHSYTPSVTTDTKTTFGPKIDESAKSDDARCSRHSNCSGLSGNCCPTNDGVMLECCS